MYLEISPRQSGKTQRLINKVIDYLSTSPLNQACIVSPKRIEFNRYFVPITIRDRIHVVKDAKKMGYFNGAVFYDDFDFLESVYITPDGYYATSLRKSRTAADIEKWFRGGRHDCVLALLSINKFEAQVFPSLAGHRIETQSPFSYAKNKASKPVFRKPQVLSSANWPLTNTLEDLD